MLRRLLPGLTETSGLYFQSSFRWLTAAFSDSKGELLPYSWAQNLPNILSTPYLIVGGKFNGTYRLSGLDVLSQRNGFIIIDLDKNNARDVDPGQSSQAVLIFPGSFNPPHYGHTDVVKEIVTRYAPDSTIMLPVCAHPAKPHLKKTHKLRVEMTKAAAADMSHAGVCVADCTCSTYKTVVQMRLTGSNNSITLFLGMDLLWTITHQKWVGGQADLKRLLKHCHIIFTNRKGYHKPSDEQINELFGEAVINDIDKLRNSKSGCVIIEDHQYGRKLSSTDVRNLVSGAESCDGCKQLFEMVPREVARIIQESGLYGLRIPRHQSLVGVSDTLFSHARRQLALSLVVKAEQSTSKALVKLKL
jgi:nicotinate-nucleotide adenylyltransferase